MPKVILVKQGETDYEKENRVQGSQDLSLNKTGQDTIKSIADQLKKGELKKVYASSVKSTSETARIMADVLSAEVITDDRLKDMNQGRWEGLTPDEIRKGYPIFFAKWERDPTSVTPPAGESIIYLLQRISQFWFEKISREKETVVIVTSKIVGALLRLYIQSGFDESEVKKRLRKLWKIYPEIPDVEELDVL